MSRAWLLWLPVAVCACPGPTTLPKMPPPEYEPPRVYDPGSNIDGDAPAAPEAPPEPPVPAPDAAPDAPPDASPDAPPEGPPEGPPEAPSPPPSP